MSDLEKIHADIKAMEQWLDVGVLDTRVLTVDQLAVLKEAVSACTSKMIAFRMGLDQIIVRRQNSN